jgi:lipid-A-disaccharide synthase-like uncharacterized protein
MVGVRLEARPWAWWFLGVFGGLVALVKVLSALGVTPN